MFFVVVDFNVECQKGSYKSTVNNTNCVECPANSDSSTERTGCICDEGFYKLVADAPCKGTLMHNFHVQG